VSFICGGSVLASTSEETLPAAAPRRSRALLQRCLEIGISLLFLWFAMRQINFQALLLALRDARWIWILPAVAAISLMLLIKSWRWQIMFRPEHRVPFDSVLTAESAGYLASNVFPGRAGEAVRLVLLASEQPEVGAARVLSTIVLERLLDTLSLLVLLVALLPFITLPEWMTRSAQALGIAALLATALIVLLSFWKARVLSWSHAVLRHVHFLDRSGVYTAIEHLIDGFAALRGRYGPALILLSFAAGAAVIAEAWFVRLAVGDGVPGDVAWHGRPFDARLHRRFSRPGGAGAGALRGAADTGDEYCLGVARDQLRCTELVGLDHVVGARHIPGAGGR
jgi:uncharacterized protein (TIRG00374 family)